MGKRKIVLAIILVVVVVLGGMAVKRYVDSKAIARQALQLQVEEPVFNFEQNVRTDDRLFWDGKEYRIDHSPLSVFGGYKELFGANEKNTVGSKGDSISSVRQQNKSKGCRAEWVIINDSLYLANIVMEGETFGDADYVKLEQMTGASFRSGSVQGKLKVDRIMPAQWVSGPFYVKSYLSGSSGKDADDRKNEQRKEQDALYKITFEAGVISKIEKTRKMSTL